MASTKEGGIGVLLSVIGDRFYDIFNLLTFYIPEDYHRKCFYSRKVEPCVADIYSKKILEGFHKERIIVTL